MYHFLMPLFRHCLLQSCLPFGPHTTHIQHHKHPFHHCEVTLAAWAMHRPHPAPLLPLPLAIMLTIWATCHSQPFHHHGVTLATWAMCCPHSAPLSPLPLAVTLTISHATLIQHHSHLRCNRGRGNTVSFMSWVCRDMGMGMGYSHLQITIPLFKGMQVL